MRPLTILRIVRAAATTLFVAAFLMTSLLVEGAWTEYQTQQTNPDRYKCAFLVAHAALFGVVTAVLRVGLVFTHKRIKNGELAD